MCALFVDDEHLQRDVVSEYLVDCGFVVITASDGDEAMHLIESPPQRFTVLPTDLHMPGSRNGCDVADRMREAHLHVHIFIVTGRPDLVSQTCGEEPSYTVIPKPFDLRHIAKRLAAL